MKNPGIQFVCSPQRIKEVFAQPGIFKEFKNSEFQILYYDVLPVKGIKLPARFPMPNSLYMEVYKMAKVYIKTFPECCKYHKRLKGNWWFSKANYTELPDKLAKQLYYTTQYIEKREHNDIWYKDITHYIDLNIYSFGQLPEGYGNPVGVSYYKGGLKTWLDKNSKLSAENRKALIKYIDEFGETNTPNAEPTDLNLLYATYQKWLSVFPFEIPYFKELKAQYQRNFLFVTGQVEHNRFLGVYTGAPHTQQTLVDALHRLTSDLLEKVNSIELVNKGVITDVQAHQADLRNETYRVKTAAIFKAYNPKEKKYVKLITDWIQIQKEFFDDLVANLKYTQTVEQQPTKTELIRKGLMEYGFTELPLVKKLNIAQQESLFELIANNQLPYQIAMLSHLGYLDYLLKQHVKSAYELHGKLAQQLNAQKNIRAIKGNILTLSPKSKEDRVKFTAHRYKETVAKDYQNLK